MSQMPAAPAQYTYNDSLPPAPLRSYFFLLTIPLVAASWVISLISQSIVTARIGNTFVGPLWFAVILQFLTLLILFYGLLTNTLPTYHATLNTFTALIIVFAVFGVDRNIFNPIIPAQKALSAGWLILAILNSIWVIYFTTAPAHPATYPLAPIQLGLRLATNKRPPPKDQADHVDQTNQVDQPRSIPSMATTIDVFPPPNTDQTSATDSRPSHSTHTYTHPPPHARASSARTGPQPTSTATTESRVCASCARTTGVRPTSTATTDSHGCASCATTGMRPTSMATSDSHARAASPGQQTIPSIRTSLNTTRGHGASPPTSPTSPAYPASGAGGLSPGPDADADGGGAQAMSVLQPKAFFWKAKALYKYQRRGDPNELSFEQGEILEIADKSGKWWEGRKADGTIGIAPSNYLQLL